MADLIQNCCPFILGNPLLHAVHQHFGHTHRCAVVLDLPPRGDPAHGTIRPLYPAFHVEDAGCSGSFECVLHQGPVLGETHAQ
jgi:hypothetical protein